MPTERACTGSRSDSPPQSAPKTSHTCRCGVVSEDVYRRLDADLIQKKDITCEGFPQLPFQFAYDSLLDRMSRSHERDSELRAMLRGCSHYSFTRKDLEEREQAADAQIEELTSQIEDLSALILSDLFGCGAC